MDSTTPAPSPRPLPSVGVLYAAGNACVLATRAIAAGEVVLELQGEQVTVASRYSVQIDTDLHIDLTSFDGSMQAILQHPWRFLNHACEPNLVVRGRQVLALADVARLQELTFDYNTTEYDMASPFACSCGSRHCYGLVRGFRHLDGAQQQRLRPLLLPHLLNRRAGKARVAGSADA